MLRHRLHGQSRCQTEASVPQCTAVSVRPVDTEWRAIRRADAHPSGFAGATVTLTTSHAAVLCAASVCTRTVKLRSCTDQGDLCGVLGLPATSLCLTQLQLFSGSVTACQRRNMANSMCVPWVASHDDEVSCNRGMTSLLRNRHLARPKQTGDCVASTKSGLPAVSSKDLLHGDVKPVGLL